MAWHHPVTPKFQYQARKIIGVLALSIEPCRAAPTSRGSRHSTTSINQKGCHRYHGTGCSHDSSHRHARLTPCHPGTHHRCCCRRPRAGSIVKSCPSSRWRSGPGSPGVKSRWARSATACPSSSAGCFCSVPTSASVSPSCFSKSRAQWPTRLRPPCGSCSVSRPTLMRRNFPSFSLLLPFPPSFPSLFGVCGGDFEAALWRGRHARNPYFWWENPTALV